MTYHAMVQQVPDVFGVVRSQVDQEDMFFDVVQSSSCIFHLRFEVDGSLPHDELGRYLSKVFLKQDGGLQEIADIN